MSSCRQCLPLPAWPADRAGDTADRCAGESAQRAACSDWNTDRFFETASVEEVRTCLKVGADPKARDRGGRTPLHLVARFNPNPDIVSELLKAGGDPRARDRGLWTPLHLAAAHNPNSAIIAVLLGAGADLKAWGGGGQTLLHLAAVDNPNPAVIAVLLDAGADPNVRVAGRETPLHAAASRNPDPAIIAALVDAGADPQHFYNDIRPHQSLDMRTPMEYLDTCKAARPSLIGAEPAHHFTSC